MYTNGVLGTTYILSAVLLAPRVGLTPLYMCVQLGQVDAHAKLFEIAFQLP